MAESFDASVSDLSGLVGDDAGTGVIRESVTSFRTPTIFKPLESFQQIFAGGGGTPTARTTTTAGGGGALPFIVIGGMALLLVLVLASSGDIKRRR